MNLEGKTALVTGSTDGVGRLVARRLADQGARVVIHGRDRHRGGQLLDEIQGGGGSAVFLPADFSSLAEVRRLADVVRQGYDRLDVLINNAGIGSGGSAGHRQTSQDGHELRFAVNYLSGFLLTRLLLPLLMLGKPARIVNVSSLGQHAIDFDDVMLTSGYSGSRAYTQSKLAQIMFTFDLARELDPAAVAANYRLRVGRVTSRGNPTCLGSSHHSYYHKTIGPLLASAGYHHTVDRSAGMRWIRHCMVTRLRTANDSYFAAMTYPTGLPTFLQPSDIHDPIWGATSAVYGGAMHPTAQGYAAIADSALPVARRLLGLPTPQ